MSDLLDVADHVASIVVAITGVIGAGWAVRRWRNRPKFMCGIPPTREDRLHSPQRFAPRKLGKASIARAFRHRRRCFAPKLRGKDRARLPPRYRQRLLASASGRRVSMGDDGLLRLPVMIINAGARAASGLSASVIIDTVGAGPLRLKNVITEALDCHLYASDRDALDDSARRRAAPAEIVAAYKELDYATWQDGVWLSGSLDAHTYELVSVIVEPNPDLREFFLIYTINCDDGWCRASTFVQGCRIEIAPATVLPPGSVPERAASRVSVG
jgi:hypothetical protein